MRQRGRRVARAFGLRGHSGACRRPVAPPASSSAARVPSPRVWRGSRVPPTIRAWSPLTLPASCSRAASASGFGVDDVAGGLRRGSVRGLRGTVHWVVHAAHWVGLDIQSALTVLRRRRGPASAAEARRDRIKFPLGRWGGGMGSAWGVGWGRVSQSGCLPTGGGVNEAFELDGSAVVFWMTSGALGRCAVFAIPGLLGWGCAARQGVFVTKRKCTVSYWWNGWIRGSGGRACSERPPRNHTLRVTYRFPEVNRRLALVPVAGGLIDMSVVGDTQLDIRNLPNSGQA